MIIYDLGCAFLTYCMQQSGRRAVEQLHDKIKLPNVSLRATSQSVLFMLTFITTLYAYDVNYD